jgi:PAS domain S-box-containing protein
MKNKRRFRPTQADPLYGAILAHVPAPIYATDSDGWLTFYNEAAADFAGRRPSIGSDRWCVTWRLREPDGTPLAHEDGPMAVTLKERRPIRGLEAIAERPNGTLVPFRPAPSPIFDSRGLLIGAVNILVDISEHKEAEKREKGLRSELSRVTKTECAMTLALQAGGEPTFQGLGHGAVERSRRLLDDTALLIEERARRSRDRAD